MIVPNGMNTFLHLESGAVITDDGATVLTIAYGARIVSIPQANQAQARALLGTAPPPQQANVQPSAGTLQSLGLEQWTASRKGM